MTGPKKPPLGPGVHSGPHDSEKVKAALASHKPKPKTIPSHIQKPLKEHYKQRLLNEMDKEAPAGMQHKGERKPTPSSKPPVNPPMYKGPTVTAINKPKRMTEPHPQRGEIRRPR
jgi:hypothetical protein